jgi:predicted transcriptional regulator
MLTVSILSPVFAFFVLMYYLLSLKFITILSSARVFRLRFGIHKSFILKAQNSEAERAGMQRSKLELYEEILYALVNKHMTVDTIAYACNMDCVALRKRLEFLLENGLVEEKNFGKRTCYTLTRRGVAIFKTLALTKRLEKLQTTMKKIDEALKAIPSLSEYSAEKTKRQKQNKNY